MSNNYKHVKHQYRKNKRQAFYNKINIYKKFKVNKDLRLNNHPDVSTITENIAFVIDGEIVEIIHCQPKMAAILLSSPEIVEIPNGTKPAIGWKYVDGKFLKLEDQQDEKN